MRLSRDLIKSVADAVAANIESKSMAKYSVPRSAVSVKIADVISANMLEEDKLNADVEKILAAHETEIAKGHMDYRKVFDLTKQKLAKERGIVL